MSKEERFVAVPVDEDGASMHPSVKWDVHLGRGSIDEHGDYKDRANFIVTVYLHDELAALELAKRIIDKVAESRRRGKGEDVIEITVNGRVSARNFQFEDLTPEESSVVFDRWIERVDGGET